MALGVESVNLPLKKRGNASLPGEDIDPLPGYQFLHGLGSHRREARRRRSGRFGLWIKVLAPGSVEIAPYTAQGGGAGQVRRRFAAANQRLSQPTGLDPAACGHPV